MLSLENLGFFPFFSTQLELMKDARELTPARISLDGGALYHLVGCRAQLGELAGRLRHDLTGIARPGSGDWVLVQDGERATIQDVFDRRTALTRRTAGTEFALQLVVANVDVFFVVTSANRDHNPRRLERYLTAVAESGARAVVVLNKVDLVDDPAALIASLSDVAKGADVVAVSAQSGHGLAAIERYCGPGVTTAMIGSSGVGKSSLANRMLGNVVQDTFATDENDKGRHTTTSRQLLMLPQGGVLIDTPGMRELGVTDEAGGVDDAFADVVELATRCRFADCQHEKEPGCALQAALASGELARERLASYEHLKREAAALARNVDKAAMSAARRVWKQRTKASRASGKTSGKRGD